MLSRVKSCLLFQQLYETAKLHSRLHNYTIGFTGPDLAEASGRIRLYRKISEGAGAEHQRRES